MSQQPPSILPIMRGDPRNGAPNLPVRATSAGSYLQSGWLRSLFLILLAFAVHAPSLSGEFIWDDTYLAHDNPLIKSPLFVWEVFRHHLFLDSLSPHYRPVQNLSFIVDYFFWHDDPFGFHLTNVTLHAVSGVLLYFLLRRLLRSLFPDSLANSFRAGAAFVVALLWTVHPVQSAAVDYISGRADSLAFLFACGSWLLYLRAREQAQRHLRFALFGLAAVTALLALCSRETAGLWLIIFLLHTLFFAKELRDRGKVAVCIGCVALVAIYGGLRALPEQRLGLGPRQNWTAPVRVVLMLRALGDYGRLMVFPANLHMERTVVAEKNYGSNVSWEQSVASEYLSICGLFVGGLLAFGCRWPGAGQTARIFGVGWFVIGFLPVSNLFELNATVAEHWLYLPSVGLLIFALGLVLDFPLRFRRALAVAVGLAAVGLSVRSAVRSGDWINPEHFYQRTIAAGGTSTRVSLNLGQVYAERGDYARAAAAFRQILVIYPGYPIAQTNLANALLHLGQTKEAEALFATAARAAPEERKEYPRTWLAAVNLSSMRRQQTDVEGALAILEKARADYPRIWEVVSFESELLRTTKGPVAAIPLVEKFQRDNWWNYQAALALGRLRAQNGETDRAEIVLRNASRLDVHEVEALNLLAEMQMNQNRLAEACVVQTEAVARQPNLPRGYVYLARILEKMGRTAEAQAATATVVRLEATARSLGPIAAN